MYKAVFQSERDVGGKLKLPGECLEDGEDFAEEAVPGEELVDPLFLEVVPRGVAVAYLPEGFDPCLPSPEVGLDAVAEVAARESAEADLGDVVVLSRAVDRDEVYSAEGA